ncbi:MAG: thioredoxin, partial [Thermosphaera sp.]
YYLPDDDESFILSEVIRELEKTIDPNILVCRVDATRQDILGEKLSQTPIVRVYYKGSIVFEQKGVFKDKELNLQVLRRGIRSTLNSKGIRARI